MVGDEHTTVSMSTLRRRVEAHRERRVPLSAAMRQAAVAAILRQEQSETPELLFIHRAEHPNDPWSGHMALPGGRVDPEDPSAFDAAVRETAEEVALDLATYATPIGKLSHMTAMAHGKPLPMIILPFVWELHGPAPALQPNVEVQEALWVPLSFLLDETNRTTVTRSYFGATWTLPCYYYGEHMIWGLTLRIVDELLELARLTTD